MQVGKLVIETEFVQWNYEIRGSHPHYTLPRVESKVAANGGTRLTREAEDRLRYSKTKHVNYVSTNMKVLDLIILQ